MIFTKKLSGVSRRRFLALAALLAVGCERKPVEFHSTDLTGATFARGFELEDHDGTRRTLADYRGKAVLVFFGYTACPDICPTTLARLAEVVKALGQQGEAVQVLFITLDPERDSGERLKQYVPWFHPSFVGLRGDTERIKATAGEFRVFSARKSVEGGMGYVLDHSTGAYVFDPAGRLRLYVKDDTPVADVVADLRQLLDGR